MLLVYMHIFYELIPSREKARPVGQCYDSLDIPTAYTPATAPREAPSAKAPKPACNDNY